MGGHANPASKDGVHEGTSNRDPEEMFCLKWNDYQENVVATLSELRQEEDFFDVTLACDGEQVHAHKLVLSACSAFFRRLLKMNPGTNPVIVLWDVAFNDLINIVDFMYNGEVKVRQTNIQSFLAVAEKFRVRGLCQSDGGTAQGTSGGSGRCSPTTNNKSGGRLSPRSKSPNGSHLTSAASCSKRVYTPPDQQAHESGSKRSRFNDGDNYVDDEDNRTPTSDISIREESHYRTSEHHHGSGSADFQEYLHAEQSSESGGGAFDERPGLQAALMGMGMSSLLDPGAAKEFLRRAAALGVNPVAMAAAAAGNSSSSNASSSVPAMSSNQSSGGTSVGSPLDPSLRRPRSVYNSQQVAQLEAYFRFNEYIDGERKRRLSQITSIPEHQIKVWFQNRRQKKKREEAEIMQGVPSQSGSVDAHRSGIDGKQDDDGADYAPPRGPSGLIADMLSGNELHAGTVEDDDDEEESLDQKPRIPLNRDMPESHDRS